MIWLADRVVPEEDVAPLVLDVEEGDHHDGDQEDQDGDHHHQPAVNHSHDVPLAFHLGQKVVCASHIALWFLVLLLLQIFSELFHGLWKHSGESQGTQDEFLATYNDHAPGGSCS